MLHYWDYALSIQGFFQVGLTRPPRRSQVGCALVQIWWCFRNCCKTLSRIHLEPWPEQELTRTLCLEMFFHTITQSPGWYIPLWGLARRNAALRIDMSLSAAWKAFLADSRMAKTFLNRMACSSSPATTACVGRVSSPTMEPGTLRPRPKTNVSGEKPMRNPLAFLAMVQRVRAYCICL